MSFTVAGLRRNQHQVSHESPMPCLHGVVECFLLIEGLLPGNLSSLIHGPEWNDETSCKTEGEDEAVLIS
ncbi:hypothetical protein K7X08_013740 [Anisodus acutangulus]|uniref:Uncharacterized protein n=1 Tax=Anisodus acutangulus TaxID=402998 RepID=A0A9Q1LP14_9SOLA|nr:hypothetical protein K7X08_013740 [Anisodus acutangulus]